MSDILTREELDEFREEITTNRKHHFSIWKMRRILKTVDTMLDALRCQVSYGHSDKVAEIVEWYARYK